MTGRRVRLAVGLALAGAALALVVVLAGFWLAAQAGTPPDSVVTQVDQVGDRVAVVQVSGAGASSAAEAARASTLRWMLAALGLGLVPMTGLAFLLAGRLASSSGAQGGGGAEADEVEEGGVDAVLLREELERERRRHLQDVVHELRTPLAVAATNLDLASTTPGLEPDLTSHLAAARRGIERLSRTVDDLAVHGRLAVVEDAGILDLAHEARALAAEQSGPAQLRRLSVQVDAPVRLLLPGDRGAVHTAVGNLLVNAVRLAPSGSVIRLACGGWEDWAWIAVQDEGPGLPVDDHERAFHRYWRGRYDLDRETGDGGARGIGLTIARQVTEAQGGHLTVRSEVGVGSTFVVWLPRSPEARTERVVADDGIHHRVDPVPAPAPSRGLVSAKSAL